MHSPKAEDLVNASESQTLSEDRLQGASVLQTQVGKCPPTLQEADQELMQGNATSCVLKKDSSKTKGREMHTAAIQNIPCKYNNLGWW